MKKGREYVGLSVQFTGIKVAARTLNISENHMRYVLKEFHRPGTGRKSPPLIARIRAQFPDLLNRKAVAR